MHPLASLAAGAAVVGLAACQSSKPQPLTGADSTALDAVRSAYQKAWNAGNVNDIIALHMQNAVVQQGDTPEREGVDAIRAFYDTTLGTPQRPTLALTRTATTGREDLAVETGTFTLTPPAASGSPAPAPMSGKYLVVLRKQADGSWKVRFDAGSMDAPPAPPPAPAKATRKRSRR